jgi:polyphosphate kinase
MDKLSKNAVKLLNSKIGLKYLLADKEIDLKKVLNRTRYEYELVRLQARLVKLQTWVIENGKKVVVIFEGRDAAGKGGAIRRITEHINPRHFKIIALDKPSEDEAHQWFFQRYVNHLPKPGQMVFFDRSWYNRAIVEPVNGFCTDKEYRVFMSQVNEFEKMLIQSDIYLIKFYFSINKAEQARRFDDIENSPLKRWKLTAVDKRAQELWDDYTKYKNAMFEATNTQLAPWTVIEANKKTKARIAAINHILRTIPYAL